MPTNRLTGVLTKKISELENAGRLKGAENTICGIVPAKDGIGPRYQLTGHGSKHFLRMNSNSYLGLALSGDVRTAEETTAETLGTGPGAVRFISGTWQPHIDLERRLASFHAREAAMLFSSAYATVMGILPPLIDQHTAVLSDELNHNCIINAIALARPGEKHIYRHLNINHLEDCLKRAAASCRRAIIVTDGVFSMRGDHAPLNQIEILARRYDDDFAENVLVVVDDSHGVGAFGARGRGTEEITNAPQSDLLVATLGKALGVNGGYVATNDVVVRYLRETSPFYIYSNPITPAEAAAALKAVEILDSARGAALLGQLSKRVTQFRTGLQALGLETLPGRHPVVPFMVRDTEKTRRIVANLFALGILATGLTYPVVPAGQEEIRFQISADHTAADIDDVLVCLEKISH